MSDDLRTIRVPAEDFEAAKEAKDPDETWGQYVRRCSENPPQVRRYVDAEAVDTVLTNPAKTTSVDVGEAIELDTTELVSKIVSELSGLPVTLESTEYNNVANEIETRLR